MWPNIICVADYEIHIENFLVLMQQFN